MTQSARARSNRRWDRAMAVVGAIQPPSRPHRAPCRPPRQARVRGEAKDDSESEGNNDAITRRRCRFRSRLCRVGRGGRGSKGGLEEKRSEQASRPVVVPVCRCCVGPAAPAVLHYSPGDGTFFSKYPPPSSLGLFMGGALESRLTQLPEREFPVLLIPPPKKNEFRTNERKAKTPPNTKTHPPKVQKHPQKHKNTMMMN